MNPPDFGFQENAGIHEIRIRIQTPSHASFTHWFLLVTLTRVFLTQNQPNISFLGPPHAPNLAMLGSIVWLIENRYSHIHEIIDILYNLFNLAALKLRELEPEIILAHFIFAIFFFGSTSEISQFTLFVPWLFLIADERVGVQVKLWDPLISRAIPECFWGDVSRRGAISSVRTFTFICVFIHQVKIAKYREREHWVLQYSSTMCNSADTDN